MNKVCQGMELKNKKELERPLRDLVKMAPRHDPVQQSKEEKSPELALTKISWCDFVFGSRSRKFAKDQIVDPDTRRIIGKASSTSATSIFGSSKV